MQEAGKSGSSSVFSLLGCQAEGSPGKGCPGSCLPGGAALLCPLGGWSQLEAAAEQSCVDGALWVGLCQETGQHQTAVAQPHRRRPDVLSGLRHPPPPPGCCGWCPPPSHTVLNHRSPVPVGRARAHPCLLQFQGKTVLVQAPVRVSVLTGRRHGPSAAAAPALGHRWVPLPLGRLPPSPSYLVACGQRCGEAGAQLEGCACSLRTPALLCLSLACSQPSCRPQIAPLGP